MAFRTTLHNLKHLAHLEAAETQTTANERGAIERHARGKKRAVEIGVFEGVNTAVLARVVDQTGVVHAVDPYFPGRLGVCWSEFIAKREVDRSGAKDKVTFVKALSWEAAEQLKGTFDFIFVDGDHSRDAVERDWKDWSAKVEPGGLILMHDTQVPSHNPAVAEYGSHKFFEQAIRHDARFELIETVDSMTVLRRKPADDKLSQ